MARRYLPLAFSWDLKISRVLVDFFSHQSKHFGDLPEWTEGAIERLGPTVTTESRPSYGRLASECGSRAAAIGLEKRTAAHVRRRLKRKSGGFWRSRFCTEVVPELSTAALSGVSSRPRPKAAANEPAYTQVERYRRHSTSTVYA